MSDNENLDDLDDFELSAEQALEATENSSACVLTQVDTSG
jgi:hypothetical protein